MDTFGLHLHQCTFNENVTVLQDLINTGNDLNQRDERGETATHIAAKFDKVNALKLLLNGGANIKAVNKDKRNVLHIAIENNSFRCIYLLLELLSCSAIINKIDSQGLSPLMMAIEKKEIIDMSLRYEQQKVVELLINHQFMGDVFQEFQSSNERKYNTHFQCAVERKSEFAIDCMIKKAQESSFESLISCPLLKDLIKLKPDAVNLRNKMNQSLLQEAIMYKNFAIIEMLVKANADCNYPDAKLRTSLFFAVDHYNHCCTEENVQQCADFEKLDNCAELRETYLITSKLFNNRCVHLTLIVYLVNEGNADVFAENCYGEKFLYYFIDDSDICESLSATIKNIRANQCRMSASRYIENLYNVFMARMKKCEQLNDIFTFEAKYKQEDIALEMFLSELTDDQKPLDLYVDQETFNCYFVSLQEKFKLTFNDEKQKNDEHHNELIRKANFWNSFQFETGFEQCEQYGNEMIHDSCLRNDVKLLSKALEILKSYEISETNDDGENALHIAVKHASLECIQLLVYEYVKFPNICDTQRKTQMDYALSLCLQSSSILRNRRAQIVACLLEVLDEASQRDSTGEVRRNLLPNAVDDLPVNHSDSLKLFSIFYAAYYGRAEIIDAIFQKFPNLDLEDEVVREWITVSLHSAAAKEYLHIIELLITKIVSYGSVGIELIESCCDELISWFESICCWMRTKCSHICILRKCVNLRKIFMRTSVILPKPSSKCCITALIVFMIEVGCITMGKQCDILVKFASKDLFCKLLRDYYVFVSKNKTNNKVFSNLLNEKLKFEYLRVNSELRIQTVERSTKKKCCVQ